MTSYGLAEISTSVFARHDERIGYHALYGPSTDPTIDTLGDDGQIPGQLSITDLDPDNATHEDGVSA